MEKYNLFQEASEMIKITLEAYNIEHDKIDISLMRKRVLDNLINEGINQQNYDRQEHYIALMGNIINTIDSLYKTKIADSIAESLKPYDYRGLPP